MRSLNNILDSVKNALSEVDPSTFYGTAAGLPAKSPWNYTVFSRSTTKVKEGGCGFSDRLTVSVVRENYVPEGMLERVIDAMRAIPGVKLDAAREVEYVYDVKPGTSRTVEMMIVRFVRGRKA